jgi:transposase
MAALLAAGIDAGQRFLDLGLAPTGETRRYKNEPGDIARLVTHLTRTGVVRVVLEAVGSFAQPLVSALVEAGLSVGVVNPRRIKAFREAEGGRAKTDRLDAQLIARFALLMSDAVRPLPDAAARALKALSTRRQQLVTMRAMEKTRLKQAHEPAVVQSHRATIAALDAACAAVEAELAARIAADAERAQAQRLLVTLPGIGPRVAGVLICDLPELGHRDRKSIASLAGLAPHVSQSGNAPPRAMIGGGRPCVRTALYMSALVAVRHDRTLKDAYLSLRAQGKPAKVALVAIARRILVTANAVLKTKTPYGPPKTLDP